MAAGLEVKTKENDKEEKVLGTLEANPEAEVLTYPEKDRIVVKSSPCARP
jgi:hypothetical protein